MLDEPRFYVLRRDAAPGYGPSWIVIDRLMLGKHIRSYMGYFGEKQAEIHAARLNAGDMRLPSRPAIWWEASRL